MTTTTTALDLDAIEARAAHLYEYIDQPEEADVSAGTDVPALLVEVKRLRDDVRMHMRVRLEVEKILDGALGPNEEDGAGGGLVADVALLADDVRAKTAELERLRAQMAAVEKFVAARAEYITAINNCHPDNSADYWRWQGHAEGRRQLAQTLDLPVAWPAQEETF